MQYTVRFLCLIIALLWHIIGSAQHKVSGTVVDSETKEPLAFVNITANNDVSGTATDIAGKFTLTYTEQITLLNLSYVGYYPLAFPVTGTDVQIELVRTEYQLREVVIVPGKNPAHRLIKQAVANRKQNHPERIPEFTYTSYNKVRYTASPNFVIKQKYPEDYREKFIKYLQTHHLFLMESVTYRKFMAPDHSKEEIQGSKVSGVKNPSFTILATDLQPFSCYDNRIELLDKEYVNPVSQGSWNRYLFVLEDTVFHGSDTTYIISFRPKKASNFESLMGLISINTNGFAIENVKAEPFHKGINDIRIQQQYVLVDSRYWFPQQLDFEVYFKEMELFLIGRSYIKDLDLRPGLTKKDFDQVELEIADSATIRKEPFWIQHRTDSLTAKDTNTYHYVDSVGKEVNLDRTLSWAEKLLTGWFPVGPLDLRIKHLYTFNGYEGNRLGLGLQTNDKMWRWGSLGGYFGYGLRDEGVKWGTRIEFYFNKNKDWRLFGAYSDDLTEPGFQHFFQQRMVGSNEGYRNLSVPNLLQQEQYEIGLETKPLRYMNLKISGAQQFIVDQSKYRLNVEDRTYSGLFNVVESTVELRYAHKEKFAEFLNSRVSLGTDWPIVWVSSSTGHLTTPTGTNILPAGDFIYTKITGRLWHDFRIRGLGEMSFMVESGWMNGSAPHFKMFYGRSAFDSSSVSLVADNTFQSMRFFEFLSDRYVTLFHTWNLGKLQFRTDKIKPELLVSNNIGYGWLNDPQVHEHAAFRTMEKGYFESGVVLRNIWRLKYLDIIYLGLGGGAYYRYGPYSFSDPLNNAAFKIDLTFEL